jgi:fermentation-respiration switch protein FrsA (DUF1100 family)
MMEVITMHVKYYLLLLTLFFLIASGFFLYPKIENFFIFFPDSDIYATPKDLGLNFKDIYFHTEDGIKIHGWFFPLDNEKPVILFCHGNAGNISHRLENIRLLLEKGLQVFIFDYRGYGKSEGRPSEPGIYKDAIAAYDYLIREENILSSNIVLFGRSLGAAVAIDLSLKREIRAIIVESGFTSTRGMAKTMFLFSLFSPLLPSSYNNAEKIASIKIPKLIIHGDSDEIVPFYMGKSLFNASPKPKYFFRIKGAGHNDTYMIGGERYFKTIATFVKDLRI